MVGVERGSPRERVWVVALMRARSSSLELIPADGAEDPDELGPGRTGNGRSGAAEGELDAVGAGGAACGGESAPEVTIQVTMMPPTAATSTTTSAKVRCAKGWRCLGCVRTVHASRRRHATGPDRSPKVTPRRLCGARVATRTSPVEMAPCTQGRHMRASASGRKVGDGRDDDRCGGVVRPGVEEPDPSGAPQPREGSPALMSRVPGSGRQPARRRRR